MTHVNSGNPAIGVAGVPQPGGVGPSTPPPNSASPTPTANGSPGLISDDNDTGEGPGRGIGEEGAPSIADAVDRDRLREFREFQQALQMLVGAQAGVGFGAHAKVRGDVIGGNKTEVHFGPASAPLTAYLLDAELLELAEHAYVPSAGDSELVRVAAARRVIVLQGPQGSGRSTAALRIIAQDRRKDCYELALGVALDTLGSRLIPDGAYLVPSLSEAQAQTLTAAMLSDLEAKLLPAGGRMFIIADDSLRFSDPGVRRYCVHLGQPPRHGDIFARHLAHRLRSLRGQADTILARQDLMAAFRSDVPDTAHRRRAAEFAFHVATLYREGGGKIDIAVLRARGQAEVAAEVFGWFQHLDEADRCLAIALGVLDGLPYQRVADAGVALHRHISATPAASRTGGFGTSRAERLGRLRARIESGVVDTELGTLPTELVRFWDDGYPRQLLQLVWDEYDVRDGLLNWLRELGGHGQPSVRVRVATAAGTLSLGAFGQVLDGVITPWARARGRQRRESAAYALKVPLSRGSHKAQVLELAATWGGASAWALRATAARVYGVDAAGKSGVALDRLDAIAETRSADVAIAIGESLSELLESGSVPASSVLDRLLHWMSAPAPARRAVGEIAFLILAGGPMRKVLGTDWPLLLHLSTSEPRVRQSVATAWNRVLNARFIDSDARTIAGAWAQSAEAHGALRTSLVTLLSIASAGDRRTTDILRIMARGWSSPDSSPYAPATANSLLSALDR